MTQDTLDALIALKLPSTLQEIFFSHEWSSMVLNIVTSAIIHGIESQNESAQRVWLEGGLLSKLMSSWKANDTVRCTSPVPHYRWIGSLCSCLHFCEMSRTRR